MGCPQNDNYKKQRNGIAVGNNKNGVVDDTFSRSGDDAIYVTSGNTVANQNKKLEGSVAKNILVKTSCTNSSDSSSDLRYYYAKRYNLPLYSLNRVLNARRLPFDRFLTNCDSLSSG